MKIISQFKMDSLEEEELALLGFTLIMDDDGKKKKKRKHGFWVHEIYKKEKNKEYFLIFYVSYDLMIESIFSSKFYFLV